MTNLADPRALRTRQALNNAAIKLLAKKPYKDITIRELVDTAGVGYTTYFRHFANTEELITELAEVQIKGLIDVAIPVIKVQGLRESARALFSYVYENRKIWLALLKGGAALKLRQSFLRQAKLSGTPMATNAMKIPFDCSINLIVCGSLELIEWWLRSRRKISVDEIAEIFDIAVVSPIIKANNFMLD